MIICSCMCLSESDIKEDLENFGETLAGKACGTCYPEVEKIMEQENTVEKEISLGDSITK